MPDSSWSLGAPGKSFFTPNTPSQGLFLSALTEPAGKLEGWGLRGKRSTNGRGTGILELSKSLFTATGLSCPKKEGSFQSPWLNLLDRPWALGGPTINAVFYFLPGWRGKETEDKGSSGKGDYGGAGLNHRGPCDADPAGTSCSHKGPSRPPGVPTDRNTMR